MTADRPTSKGTTDRADATGATASRYPLAFAVLLLLGAALALVVADAEAANVLAAIAYWALAAGVALRLAEVAGLGGRAAPVVRAVRSLGTGALERWSALAAVVTRVRGGYRRATSVVPIRSLLDADVEDGIRLSIPLTAAAGVLYVGWWWLDPARTVSAWFLAGWALALLGQLWLSVVVPELRRAY